MDVNQSHLKIITLLMLVARPDITLSKNNEGQFIWWVKRLDLTKETLRWIPGTGRYSRPDQTLWLETDNVDGLGFEFTVTNTTCNHIGVLADSLFDTLSESLTPVQVETPCVALALAEPLFPDILYFEGTRMTETSLKYYWVDINHLNQTTTLDQSCQFSTWLAVQLLVVCLQTNTAPPGWVKEVITAQCT
jgi:hypothetical protein